MKKALIAVLILLLASPVVMAKTIEGVDVPETIILDGQNLVLNGAGVRNKKVVFINIDVYVAGLYLQSQTSDAQVIIDAEAPMAIRLYMTTGMASKEKMIDAWNEGFESVTGGNTEPLQEKIEKFNAMFNKDPEEGDMYEIAYIPGTGITVAMNEEIQGDPIAGLEFKKAVFGIWLGKNLEDKYLKALKSGLLGK